jgi:hypothetical protein
MEKPASKRRLVPFMAQIVEVKIANFEAPTLAAKGRAD